MCYCDIRFDLINSDCLLSRIRWLYFLKSAHSVIGHNAHDQRHSSDLRFIFQSIHKLFWFSYSCTGIGLLICHIHVFLLFSSSDHNLFFIATFSSVVNWLTTSGVYFESYWVTVLLNIANGLVHWFKQSLLFRFLLFASFVLVIVLEWQCSFHYFLSTFSVPFCGVAKCM